ERSGSAAPAGERDAVVGGSGGRRERGGPGGGRRKRRSEQARAQERDDKLSHRGNAPSDHVPREPVLLPSSAAGRQRASSQGIGAKNGQLGALDPYLCSLPVGADNVEAQRDPSEGCITLSSSGSSRGSRLQLAPNLSGVCRSSRIAHSRSSNPR